MFFYGQQARAIRGIDAGAGTLSGSQCIAAHCVVWGRSARAFRRKTAGTRSRTTCCKSGLVYWRFVVRTMLAQSDAIDVVVDNTEIRRLD